MLAVAVPQALQTAFLLRLIDAIERIHGRLGKILISQYLSGSQNAKIQKLRLHRLSGFGMLEGSKQADVMELLDLLLANGLLKQQEVNRNRPTVAVAPELEDPKQRRALVAGVQFPPKLLAKFGSVILKQGSVEKPVAPATVPTAQGMQLDAKLPRAIDHLLDFSEVPKSNTATDAVGRKDDAKVNQLDASKQPPARPAAQLPELPPVQRPELQAEQQSEKPPIQSPEVVEDWTWSVKLFTSGNDWNSVMAIRRMTDIELAGSLISALQQGERIDRGWLAAPDGGSDRTVGQQRVHRELQRRSAAGVR